MRNQVLIGFAMFLTFLSVLALHRTWAQTGTPAKPLVQSAGQRLM